MRTGNQLFWRGILLFLIGTIFTFVIGILQTQHRSLNHQSINLNQISSQWWLPLVCGLGSAVVGLVYPGLKSKGSDPIKSQEWSHVLRCVAMFVGINEACIKVEFPSNLQLSISLAILSVGLWWYFDRTPIGFGMGIIVAITATVIFQVLVYNHICIFTEGEFLYLKSWLPSVVFSGGITVANIGEQLAVNDNYDGENKSHTE